MDLAGATRPIAYLLDRLARGRVGHATARAALAALGFLAVALCGSLATGADAAAPPFARTIWLPGAVGVTLSPGEVMTTTVRVSSTGTVERPRLRVATPNGFGVFSFDTESFPEVLEAGEQLEIPLVISLGTKVRGSRISGRVSLQGRGRIYGPPCASRSRSSGRRPRS